MLGSMTECWGLVLSHLEMVGVQTRGTVLLGFHLLCNPIGIDSTVCVDGGLICHSRFGRTDGGFARVRALMVVIGTNLNIVTASATMCCCSICLRGGE